MGTVTSLDEFRGKKATPSGIYIEEGQYPEYANKLRLLRVTLNDLDYNYPPAKDPDDPKRLNFVEMERTRLKKEIETLEKAVGEYADRSFKPELLKAVEDGQMTVPLPAVLPSHMLLKIRVTLTEEYRRQGYLVKRLKEELDNAVPFRDDLIAVHEKQLTSQLKIKQALVINNWWEEDKV